MDQIFNYILNNTMDNQIRLLSNDGCELLV